MGRDTGYPSQQHSALWPPLPHRGECLECDELIRWGLLLHLAQSTEGGGFPSIGRMGLV